ncbi:MAG: S41 family peptidase [Bacteroidales bacterium]|nr:S41 family peptidase [Bacteroidales bacterium]
MRKIIILLLVVFTLVSCRKESTVSDFPNPNHRIAKSFLQQFETVWHGMDQGYVFWGADTVDWDARYEQFQPIFAEFDSRPANHPVSEYEYQAAYAGLFEGLLDHHLMGMFYSPKGRFAAYVNPGQNDYMHTTSARAELEKEIDHLKKRKDLIKFIGYEGDDYGEVTIPGTYFALIKGKKSGELIAYFRFTNFYLNDIATYHSAIPNGVSAQAALKAFYGPRYWEGINSQASYANNDSVVGIIMDLRGNGGGNTGDLSPYIASLSQGTNLVGYTRVKDGFGRLDYAPWAEYNIYAPSARIKTEKPIVVLADINSVSCAELATMLIKNLPNGTFIGERTYGAIGALQPNSEYMHDIFFSGCMGDQDFMKYGAEIYRYKDIFAYYIYTSTFHMVDKDHNPVEGVGVQPDYEIRYNRSRLFDDGKDIQLENAIYYIKNGRILSTAGSN